MSNAARYEQEKALETVEKAALEDLSKTIQVTIESVTKLSRQQDGLDVYTQLDNTTSSYVKRVLHDVETIFHFDKKQDRFYAFSYVTRSSLVAQSKNQYKSHAEKAGYSYERAVEAIDSENFSDGLLLLTEAFNELYKAEEERVLLLSLGITSIEDAPVSFLEIEDQRLNIINAEIKSLDGLADFLAAVLGNTINLRDSSVYFIAPTVKNSGVVTEFGKELKVKMQQRLRQKQGWSFGDYGNQVSFNNTNYTLEGAYLANEAKGSVEVILTVRDNLRGSFEVVTSSIALANLPGDMEINPSVGQALYDDLSTITAGGGSSFGAGIEIKTNKGNSGLYFAKDERFSLFVKTNLPGYLRIVYYLPDKRMALLYNNLEVQQGETGNWLQVPQEWYVAPPYGIELIQVMYQERPWGTLETYQEGGITYIDNSIAGFSASNQALARYIKKELIIRTGL